MKFLFVLISILSFTVSVLAELEILELCSSECKIFQKCVSTVYAGQTKYTVNLYPPKEEFGLCNCQDEDQYFNCLKCYNTKKNKKQYVEGVLKNHCEILKEEMGNSDTINNPETKENPDNVDSNTSDKTVGEDNNKENNKKGGSGTKIGLIILGVVAVAGVAGYVFYSRKQKERPESMPFFGNSSATSPPAYSTLGSSKAPPSYSISTKDMNDTNNLTSDYNTQFYNNVDTNQYTYKFEPSNEEFNDQYEVDYQYGNQYANNNYDNNVVGTTAADTNNVAAAAETKITVNDTAQDTANYESRRESMIPGSRPTSTNIPGHYVCSYKYDPQLDDELALHVDDKVQIIEEYEDGWMKAINLTTGQEGMAPRVCIKEA